MVEIHQSCASSLVNTSSALCAIGQGNNSVNVIAEISDQLQRERQKNAELTEKISILESQLQERAIKQPFPTDIGAGSCPTSEDRCFKKCKTQDIETTNNNGTESENIMKSTKLASEKKHDVQCLTQKDLILDSQLVNWMSMDETHFLQFEKTKDGDSTPDFDHDTDVSDDEADDYHQTEAIENSKAVTLLKDNNDEICVEGSFVFQNEACFTRNGHKELVGHKPVCNTQMEQLRNQNMKEVENITDSFKTPLALSGSLAHHKKPTKVAFCPKEVKRIMESEALQLKNAQSHTIRKIIVFSSLGIRHGCEDMYELDFNHFSILRKGESFVSPTNPGEHVLYENPGVRRKVFYPNLQNPTLCPVQIIEEEKAMRPSDASCPSCLFLCIKYGGRTRNLPQNEYVRQRMGRNKLKSFGPLMCRMAMLVHIRSGSFFFKALGITLLFMAGYPDDLVQRETKHRNLDLLQKYYRTDEETEGEVLFLQQPLTCDIASPSSQQLTGKTNSTKSKGKKQTNTNNKAQKMQSFSLQQSSTLNSPSPTQFGLMGYTSIHSHAMAAFQSVPSQSHKPAENPPTSSSVAPYHMLPPQPANGFVPMMYWPPPNTYPPPGPYAPSFGYQSFLSTGNYITVHPPPPYFSHPYCNPIIPKSTDRAGKSEMDAGLEEVDSDYVTGSSSTETKKI